MADAYQGKIISASKARGSLKIRCRLGKKKLFGYLHEHGAEVSFSDDPRKNDKFLERHLKKGNKIKIIFG